MKNDSKGNLEFTSDNEIRFNVVGADENDEDSYEEHILEFVNDPHEFAKRLREAADWLDSHGNDAIIVEID